MSSDALVAEAAGGSQDRADHITDILITHPGIDWQRYLPLILTQGYREIFGPISIRITVVRMQMEGDEMHAGADIQASKLFNKSGPVQH